MLGIQQLAIARAASGILHRRSLQNRWRYALAKETCCDTCHLTRSGTTFGNKEVPRVTRRLPPATSGGAGRAGPESVMAPGLGW